MSKEDSSSGLLAKMAKFVRNPAASWSGIDSISHTGEEAASKQLLKELIERKRRNDFVRRREFDMLRKLRKREAKVGQNLNARPSFFQSSMPSKHDDRAKTLKKIDEIEAQMSMQWWKSNSHSSPNSSSLRDSASASSQPSGDTQSNSAINSLTQSGDYEATQITENAFLDFQQESQSVAPDDKPAPPLTQPVVDKPPKAQTSAPARAPNTSAFQHSEMNGFSASKLQVIDADKEHTAACLEDAAIRFANADNAGAEAALLEILSPTDLRSQPAECWMMLFDLYRASDQQEKFEATALEFVQYFERSAPQWFSMPAMVKQLAKTDMRALNNGPSADWVCPSVIGAQTVATLRVALDKFPTPWRLDWRKLKLIEAAALKPLGKIFATLAQQDVQLHFFGNEKLQSVLQLATVSGDDTVDTDWWLLRLNALRVTCQPDQFEVVALDYCVTYEVSPPAWANALCSYKPLSDEALTADDATFIQDVYSDSLPSTVISVADGDTQISGLASQLNRLVSVELSGQINGDPSAVFAALEAQMMGIEVMEISCAKLIRVDFAAAGTLLNWVTSRASEGRSVKFTEVNRLVAVFFNVIGISEHAVIETRND
jgi:ABC-type transporter Mla MlaB component